MLALLLDRHGVRSVLFNTEETTRWHPKGSSQGARTMEHYRRLGISGQVRDARDARRSSDRRDLFHPLRRLGIGAPADAVGGRKAQGDRRRAQDRSSARTAASRQPDVCREIPARTCAHAAEHRGAVRLAGGRLRRRTATASRSTPYASATAGARPGAAPTSPAATAGKAWCGARSAFTIPAPRCSRPIWAAACSRPMCGCRRWRATSCARTSASNTG